MEFEMLNKEEKTGNSNTATSKTLVIELEEWDNNGIKDIGYQCGTNIYINGEKIEDEDGTRVPQALRAVLNYLGYKVEIISH